jgi:hypothetical protein
MKYHGKFGMEFYIESFYGKSMFITQFSTKLFCAIGLIVYV